MNTAADKSTLADISLDVSYGYTASAANKPVGPKFLRITDIQGGVVNWDTVPFCKIDSKDKEKYLLEQGDIVIARTGNSTGENYLFASEREAIFASYLIRFRIDQSRALPEFVWYQLRSRRWWGFLDGIKGGSAQAGANAKALGTFPCSLPDISTQEAVVEILSTLDEKIELNRKQNQTLEAIAQALFKHWFVDFEFPDENGHPYKSSGGAMQPSELGEIPVGWAIAPLQNCFNFLEGPGIRNWQYVSEGTRFINIRLIKDLDIDISSANCVSDDEANGKYDHFKLSEKDIVISTSGTLGKCAIVRNSHLPLLLNTSVIRFRPIRPYSLGYMYSYLNSSSFKEELLFRASGSVQLNFGPTHLKQIVLVRPEDWNLGKFADLTDPLIEKIITNLNEIEILRDLRDTLLPKLMSGELRVA